MLQDDAGNPVNGVNINEESLPPFVHELAGDLPYGEQRRLEIARALALAPSLLLLDEPAAGMNPQETADLMALIRRIRSLGITVFLIEHDMKLVMGISEHIVVLDHGEVIADGPPETIKNAMKGMPPIMKRMVLTVSGVCSAFST